MTLGAAVGFALLHPQGPGQNSKLVAASLRMLDLPLWEKPLRYLSVSVFPGKPYPRRPGVIVNNDRDRLLEEMLAHPDVCEVTLASSAKSAPDFATASIGSRPRFNQVLASTSGRQSVDSANAARRDQWIDAVISFAADVHVTHGVIAVMSDAAVLAEGSFCGIVREGVLDHPFPKEFERMELVTRELGITYVRFPRWGTIYSHAHIHALGGVERLRAVVEPAVIRDLGDAIYVQLTDSIATALSEESLVKQRAFTELAGPLLPPARAA